MCVWRGGRACGCRPSARLPRARIVLRGRRHRRGAVRRSRRARWGRRRRRESPTRESCLDGAPRCIHRRRRAWSARAGTFQCEENLLEIGLRQRRARRDIAHRDGAGFVGVQSERQHRSARIVATRRHPHGTSVNRGQTEAAMNVPATAASRATSSLAPSSLADAAPRCPEYSGACVTNVVPSLLSGRGTADLPEFFPDALRGADASFCSWSTGSVGTSCASVWRPIRASRRRSARCRAARSPRLLRPPPSPRSPR